MRTSCSGSVYFMQSRACWCGRVSCLSCVDRVCGVGHCFFRNRVRYLSIWVHASAVGGLRRMARGVGWLFCVSECVVVCVCSDATGICVRMGLVSGVSLVVDGVRGT